MKYLSGLDPGDQVDYSDMIFATRTLYRNNVIEFLLRNGYKINNLSIFDIKDHPTLPFVKFKSDPSELISNSTFTSRVKRDIGWNFYHFFAGGKMEAEKIVKQDLKQLASVHHKMIKEKKELVERSAMHSGPSLNIFHYMITHNPFLFNVDGSFNHDATFTSREGYINNTLFANKVVKELVDNIISFNKDKDFMILIQSDHGFRYEEYEPEFETESCKIFYAVYCSDNDYSHWNNDISSINSFRIIFNKYFQTSFPLLSHQTHILRYKKQKK